MKKFIIGFTVFALVAIGTIFAFGQKSDGGGKWRKHRGGKHRDGFGMMAKKLNLTDAQKEQVKQISEASRAKIKPLMEQMKANRQQLKSLTENGQFDEAQIQNVANQQGVISAQLIVEKTRVKAQMFQILTPEQKAQAAALKEQMKEKMKQRFENRKQKKAEKTASETM